MIETYQERKRREARIAELEALRGEMDAVTASVAQAERETATDNHDTGALVVVGGTLYRATRAILRGERIAEGINVTRISVAEVIREVSTKE